MIFTLIALLLMVIFCGIFGILSIRILSHLSSSHLIKEEIDITLIFWLGLILICWLLMIFSFFIKIGLLVFVVLGSFTVIITIWQRVDIQQILLTCRPNPRNYKILIGCIIIFLFYIISKSTTPISNYDSGLYHIQNIKWLETYPIIPGLGNLHGRFAFNSSFFILSAFFGLNYFFGFRIYILNIFIVFLSTFFFARKISQISQSRSLSTLLSLIIFLYSLLHTYTYVNSPTPDLSITLLEWIILILFIEKFEFNTLQTWDLRSWAIFLFTCFAFTIKVSSLPLFLLSLFLIVKSFQSSHHWPLKNIFTGCIFLVPWLAQNIIISGTLIYPIAFLQVPWLDWSIPKENIEEMARIVHSWAILPYTDRETVLSMNFMEWFPKWVVNRSYEDLVLTMTTGIGMFLFVIQDGVIWLKSRNKGRQDAMFFIFLDLYFLFALTYWFLTAPDPRFGYGYLVAGFLLFFARIFKPLLSLNIVYKSLIVISFIFFLVPAGKLAIHPILRQHILFPPKESIGETQPLYLDDSLTILTPISGDQCWDAPLPCTYLMFPGVTARGDDLSDGFRAVVKP